MGLDQHSWTSRFLSYRSGGNALLQRLIVCFFCCSFLVAMGVDVDPTCVDEDGPVSTVQMALRAKVLIFGKVLKQYPDQRYDFGNGTDVYTAELEVFCVLKGPKTNRIVNITEAGYIPGHCFSTSLVTNENFIVIADHNGSTYRSGATEIRATSAKLDEVSQACGLDPKYPYGVSERTSTKRCLTPAPPSQCKDEMHFTTTTTTTTMPSTASEYYDETLEYYDPPTPTLPNDTNDSFAMRLELVSSFALDNSSVQMQLLLWTAFCHLLWDSFARW